MPADWNEVRRQFPVLERWTYLNSATFGPVPLCALEAAGRHWRRRDEQACIDFLDWFTDADRVRGKAARLIGAQPDDIAFVPSAGAALSWLMQGIDWKPGDQVLALAHEFPNNLYYPLAWRERQVEFVEMPLPDGCFRMEDFLARLTSRTRLVLLSTVNYATGLRPPLEEIGAALRELGILFYADATQSLGALRLDVKSAAVSFLALHGYKWMLSPAGIGFACIPAEVRQWLSPAIYSWRSHYDWRNVDQLHHGPPELPEAAMRYEGGVLNFSGIYAMEAVLDLIASLGAEAVEQRVLRLAAKTRAVLRSHGGVLLADRQPYYESPIVTAQFPGVDMSKLAVELKRRRIVVAARQGNLRVSPHFFNNEEDLARLDEALRDFRSSEPRSKAGREG
jgi:selenocysteine lyase/cysteine desulfurase